MDGDDAGKAKKRITKKITESSISVERRILYEMRRNHFDTPAGSSAKDTKDGCRVDIRESW